MSYFYIFHCKELDVITFNVSRKVDLPLTEQCLKALIYFFQLYRHTDGIEYTRQCLCCVTSSFWEEFSRQFALSATGTFFYLGYRERESGTFHTDSFFATTELPNLTPPSVSRVVAMIIHRQGHYYCIGHHTYYFIELSWM